MLPNFGTYLDQASDDIFKSLDICANNNIKYIGIRSAYKHNLLNVQESILTQLQNKINNTAQEVVLVDAKINNNSTKDEIKKAFDIAHYYNSLFIKIDINNAGMDKYLDNVMDFCYTYNLTAVHEINFNSPLYDSKIINSVLLKYKRLKLIFDPAELIIQRNINPYNKYYKVCKPYIKIVDLHDYKIGHGHKPIGYGDTGIMNIVKDCYSCDFEGWYMLEPNLGHKYKSINKKEETFLLALNSMRELITQLN